MAGIIQQVPNDGANFGGTGGAIKSFDTDIGHPRQCDKVRQIVRDTKSGTTVNQDAGGV